MAECRQCGVSIMIPPEDQICPLCGCEDMYDYELSDIYEELDRILQEEINREVVRAIVLWAEVDRNPDLAFPVGYRREGS